MGEKYGAPEAPASSGALVRNKLMFLIPASILVVFLLLNSSFWANGVASSDPVGGSAALGSSFTPPHKGSDQVQDGKTDNEVTRLKAELIAMQCDSLIGMIPRQEQEKTKKDKQRGGRAVDGDEEEEEADEGEESSEDDDLIRIDPKRVWPMIWGDKKKLAATDAWKFGPHGSALEFMERRIRSGMLPYSTRKALNSVEQSCEGRRVHVYDLPPEFNKELVGMCDHLFPWFNLCKYITDSGRGVPVNAVENGKQVFVPSNKWFNTHQYALEMVSHARILKHKCRTEDRSTANLFYIPYYAGLDKIRWDFEKGTSKVKKDALSLKLICWLQHQPEFRRHNGKDHLLILGKITWDFRRQEHSNWGSSMLLFPEMRKVARLLIERDPWCENDIGVPHPSYFHPQSASDIDKWLAHVRSQKRTHLVTFVGMERRNNPANPRTALVRQCMNATSETDCKFVECTGNNCYRPAFVTGAFLSTHFCMQPVGDSPTRRSVFDSLIAGCIPVLFHPLTAYTQYPWHLPRNESLWSVYIPGRDVIAGTVSVVDTLKKISVAQRDAMREFIISTMIPGLLYSAPGADVSPYRDAFDISIDQVLHRVKLNFGSSIDD